jgi:capsular polysaccharide biosynthesis protein
MEQKKEKTAESQYKPSVKKQIFIGLGLGLAIGIVVVYYFLYFFMNSGISGHIDMVPKPVEKVSE